MSADNRDCMPPPKECQCCECRGIKCFLDHPGHNHATDAAKKQREAEEMWEEALRMNF
jgi:hypothetical protein